MRVVIVDGYTLTRKGTAALLDQEPGLEILGEAASTDEAAELINRVKPEVVVLDTRLREENGLDVIKKCRKNEVQCKFIALASSTNEIEFKQACQMGVNGYVLKSALPEELMYAIRLVYQGRKYYDPVVMDHVMGGNTNPIDGLTPREMDVLLALGRGMNNHLIAKQLYITEFTVKKHISQILSKLNLRDRTEAALFANSKGLVAYR